MFKRLLAGLLAVVFLTPLTVSPAANTSTPTSLDPEYLLGDVNGDGRVTISDSLEILKYLAKLPNSINDQRSFNAARIVNPGVGSPTIHDALEILKKLAKLFNKIDIPYLDDVIFVQKPIDLERGATHSLSSNHGENVRFESRNPSVAVINRDGVITAVNRGSAHLSVWIDELLAVVFTVNVYLTTESLRVTNFPDFISAGESVKLDVEITPSESVDKTEFSIPSSDRSRAGITQDGVLTGLARGSATVTVVSGRVSRDYTVTVETPAINNPSIMLVEGESDSTLRVDGTQRTVQWRSSNPAVARVDSSGRITALTAGYTCIIATVGGIEYYCDVRVITPLERRISSLQNKYPHGYYWNNHTRDPEFPHVSTTPCRHQADVPMRCIGQCAGFANLISNEVFGVNAVRRPITNVNAVRQGDYVRYSNRPNHFHSVLVLRVEREGEIIGYDRRNGTHITARSTRWLIVHCNWWRDCGIIWYAYFNPADVISTFHSNQSFTRY
jgi:uncharacterized protein YjdB